ncbi:hypothetical protein PG987_010768 [Apiospora arundinis]
MMGDHDQDPNALQRGTNGVSNYPAEPSQPPEPSHERSDSSELAIMKRRAEYAEAQVQTLKSNHFANHASRLIADLADECRGTEAHFSLGAKYSINDVAKGLHAEAKIRTMRSEHCMADARALVAEDDKRHINEELDKAKTGLDMTKTRLNITETHLDWSQAHLKMTKAHLSEERKAASDLRENLREMRKATQALSEENQTLYQAVMDARDQAESDREDIDELRNFAWMLLERVGRLEATQPGVYRQIRDTNN